jgi:superfamily I DNA/RNA helicase
MASIATPCSGVPAQWLGRDRRARHYHPDHDSVKVLTFHACKGLEFPVIAIPGLGYLPRHESSIEDEARLLRDCSMWR